MKEKLSAAEKKKLAKLEGRIREGLSEFAKWKKIMADALAAIHADLLYREHGTFTEYCEKVLGISRQRGYQLIDWSGVSTIVDAENEAQARVLAPHPPETQAAAIAAVQEDQTANKLRAELDRMTEEERLERIKSETDAAMQRRAAAAERNPAREAMGAIQKMADKIDLYVDHCQKKSREYLIDVAEPAVEAWELVREAVDAAVQVCRGSSEPKVRRAA